MVTTHCSCFSTWAVLDRELWVLVLWVLDTMNLVVDSDLSKNQLLIYTLFWNLYGAGHRRLFPRPVCGI